MAEGRLVVRALLEGGARFRARSALMTEAALESLRDVVGVEGGGPPVFVAEQEIFNQIAGFNVHRGCLAVGERGEALEARALLSGLRGVEDSGGIARPGGEEEMVVGVEQVSNHDNIGGIFRNASAFGVGGVLMCPRCCDPLYRKSIRVSMGAALRVPFARASGMGAMLDALEEAEFTIVALTPGSGSEEIGEVGQRLGGSRRVALLVGAEGPGLSEATMRRAHFRARIAMAPGVDSLNVAVAAGIAMHRLGPNLRTR